MVAAFLSDAVATQSGYEMPGFVSIRERREALPRCRFGALVS